MTTMGPLDRRELLARASRGLGSLALAPLVANLRLADPRQFPKRFVFVCKSNGLLPYGIQPVGLEAEVNGHSDQRVRTQQMTARPLSELTLHPTMAALEPLQDRVNVVQGLSAKMCSGNHSAHYGALGVYPMRQGGPKAATIDWQLAQAFPSIFGHVGLMLAEPGRKVHDPRLSASGPGTPLSYYADPVLAYQHLFGAVAKGDAETAARARLDGDLLDFMVRDVKRVRRDLPGSEQEHLDHYLHGFEALRARRQRVAALGDSLADRAPAVDGRFTSEVETDRLAAQFEIGAAALLTGLTNVVSFSVDSLETRYSGLGLGHHTVHHLGHLEVKGNTGGDPEDWEGKDGVTEGREARDRIRKFHFDLIAGLAKRLDAVPEGDGTMLDNTLIVFFAESGDRHHPGFETWPVVTVGGLGGALRTGSYLRYPSHGARGHATLGNLYTTLLHAAGHPQDGYGTRDVTLGAEIDQGAPLEHLLA